MLKAQIKGIEYYVPERILDNETLAESIDNWTADKIKDKTGIGKRHITEVNETALDLAEKAALKLFDTKVCSPKQIDFILFCTQSPDYFLPTTACILQERLEIPTTVGAVDYNLGCSGFVYGLSLAKGLIETGQVKNVLLITAETYSKYIKDDNVNVRTIFGDAAAATFVEGEKATHDLIGPFVFGTDGSGKDNLIVKNGACRNNKGLEPPELYMNGPDIFLFTIQSVPRAVEALLDKSNYTMEEVDQFVFHQANQYMLEHLRDKIQIPEDKFYLNVEDYGNTVSSTIPIALSQLMKKTALNMQMNMMVVGFGVGYSWSASMIKI